MSRMQGSNTNVNIPLQISTNTSIYSRGHALGIFPLLSLVGEKMASPPRCQRFARSLGKCFPPIRMDPSGQDK